MRVRARSIFGRPVSGGAVLVSRDRQWLARLQPRSRLWRLRANLLTPTVALALMAWVGLWTVAQLSARESSGSLGTESGGALVEQLAAQIRDKQRLQESLVQLIADDRDLATLVERRDRIGLAQALLPLRTRL